MFVVVFFFLHGLFPRHIPGRTSAPSSRALHMDLGRSANFPKQQLIHHPRYSIK
jgi:hypothetical protein